MQLTNKLKRYGLVSFIVLIGLGVGVGNLPAVVAQTNPEELKRTIDERTKELNAINAQIEAANANLSTIRGEKRTLNNELRSYEQSIEQVTLSIRASEVTLDKLTLELESLNLDLENIISSIADRKEEMAETLRLLQKKDREGLLHILLKNQSLVDGAFEVQSIRNIQDALYVNVNDLDNLQQELSETIEETENKKASMLEEEENLRNRKLILGDQKSAKDELLDQVENKESLFQQQLSELEAKQREISRELADIEEQLRLAFDPTLLPTKRPGVLGKPCDVCTLNSSVLTQHYGRTNFAAQAYSTGFHNGVDWGLPTGTPIIAAEDGVIKSASNNGRLQYGRHVLIEHNNNLSTLYAHLSLNVVSTGDTVKKGQIIGYSGNTGFSTGPHLHFTAYWAPSVILEQRQGVPGLLPIGVTIDPSDYL